MVGCQMKFERSRALDLNYTIDTAQKLELNIMEGLRVSMSLQGIESEGAIS